MLPFWVNLVQIMTKLYVKFMTLDPKSLMDRAKTENIHFNGFFSTPTLVSKNEMHGMVSMKPSALNIKFMTPVLGFRPKGRVNTAIL